jgi:pantoate--beta-alanine ligase
MPEQSVVLRTVPQLRGAMARRRAAGGRVALVATMGALHAGHRSLIDLARNHARHIVVSIFVNPAQFGPQEDLASYPRTFAADCALIEAAGGALIYAPAAETIYPPGFTSRIEMSGPAAAGLEDRFRPSFFTGVATIVLKLLIQAGCDAAVFGEKDYQQLLVVRRLVADFDLPTEILAAPTVRDADGLALSSRNSALSDEERQRAAALPAVLGGVATGLRQGEPARELLDEGRRALMAAGFALDYLEIRDAATLGPPQAEAPQRLLAAARIGRTRLIDNMAV